MIVRHKRLTDIARERWEVLATVEALQCWVGRKCGGLNSSPQFLYFTDYEPIPDERWEDMTDKVFWDQTDECLGIHLEVQDTKLTGIIRRNYRLVKRSLWEAINYKGPFDLVKKKLESVFVLQVERKVRG